METKEFIFYNFSIEKLIELSKDSNSSQFLAEKQSGEYEVMYFTSDYRIY